MRVLEGKEPKQRKPRRHTCTCLTTVLRNIRGSDGNQASGTSTQTDIIYDQYTIRASQEFENSAWIAYNVASGPTKWSKSTHHFLLFASRRQQNKE